MESAQEEMAQKRKNFMENQLRSIVKKNYEDNKNSYLNK